MGPQLIGPSRQTVLVPNQFGFYGQIVPQNLDPMDKWSPTYLGPTRQMVPFVQRERLWDPEIQGPNWLGTICPGGPDFWGPFV